MLFEVGIVTVSPHHCSYSYLYAAVVIIVIIAALSADSVKSPKKATFVLQQASLSSSPPQTPRTPKPYTSGKAPHAKLILTTGDDGNCIRVPLYSDFTGARAGSEAKA